LNISIDESVELVSAAARLAGFEEYTNNTNESYVTQLDSLMSPFKEHPAIKYLIKVRGRQGVSYDAIAQLAAHTAIKDGDFVYLDGAEISNDDARWKPGQGAELAVLLNDLYHKTGFSDFYSKNLPFYEKVTVNAIPLLESSDINWLTQFYGKPLNNSRIVISLLNVGNYGITKRIDGEPDESVIIIGCRNVDNNKIPVFGGLETLIVHESSHPVCNPLISANLSRFNDNINLAAEFMSAELSRQAYAGAETMMCESMVRGAELQWQLAHASEPYDTVATEHDMRAQMSRGFIFMPEIMDAYNNNKGKPIDSMMPGLIEAINNVDVTARYKEIVNGSPKISGCSIEEGATGIAPSDSLEIKFFFDQPINRSFGMAYLDDRKDIIPDLADCANRVALDDSRKVLTVKIVAEPDKEYGFIIRGDFFRGDKGYPGQGQARVHFFTSD